MIVVTGLVLIHFLLYSFKADLTLTGTFSIHSLIIGYAPEVWLALMSLVFGTLIIVISIASQTTPKIIDYYIMDFKSLMYIWFITLGSFECFYLHLVMDYNSVTTNTFILLNVYMFLPGAIILAVPYVFYILSYTKTSNVIEKIYRENRRGIRLSTTASENSSKKAEIQALLFESINKLDDLFQYVQFKEPKGDIIKKLGLSMEYYFQHKARIQPDFFYLSEEVKNDISFKTLKERFSQIDENRTFYEQKVLRVLAGAYQKLLDQNHFNLASHCAGELCEIGKRAHQAGDRHVVDLVLIEFNTFLRFGIKQAEKTREIRNLYNAVFHYSQLVTYFIETEHEEKILQSCKYLTYYWKELLEFGFLENSFFLAMDTFADELRTILISLHYKNASNLLQEQILKMFIRTDLPFENKEKNLKRIKSNNVRIIKIGLCLFYLEKGEEAFAKIIMDEIFRDLSILSIDKVKTTITDDCRLLEESSPTFWEDTDRGNRNIYYSPYKNQLDNFRAMIDKKIGVTYVET